MTWPQDDFLAHLDRQFIDGEWRAKHHDKLFVDANPFPDQPIVAFGREKRSGPGSLKRDWSLSEFTTSK